MLFAKPGKWQTIRSTTLDPKERRSVRAARRGVTGRTCFDRFLSAKLAKLSPKQFAHVARMYDVGAADDDCRPGGARAVRLAPAFVADLLARPELPVAGGESSPQAREETPNESATGGNSLVRQ